MQAAFWWIKIKKNVTKLFGQIKENRKWSKLGLDFEYRPEEKKYYDFYFSLVYVLLK